MHQHNKPLHKHSPVVSHSVMWLQRKASGEAGFLARLLAWRQCSEGRGSGRNCWQEVCCVRHSQTNTSQAALHEESRLKIDKMKPWRCVFLRIYSNLRLAESFTILSSLGWGVYCMTLSKHCSIEKTCTVFGVQPSVSYLNQRSEQLSGTILHKGKKKRKKKQHTL